MSMTTATSLGPAPTFGEESVDLLDIATVFLVEWRRGLAAAILTLVVGIVYIYTIKPLYEASGSISPQVKDTSGSLTSLFSGRSSGDVYIGLLESRSVADIVIDRTDLLRLYHTKSREQARAILVGRSSFTVGKDTLIMLKVRDQNAETAMQVTNAYIDALESQQELMAVRRSELRGRFFQDQISKESKALAAAEQDLKNVQETTGIIQADSQTQIGLNAIAGARNQITTLQVQLAGLLQSETEANPQVETLRSQINKLQVQEYALESRRGSSGVGAAASAGKMPQLNLDYTRKLREVKYHEALLTSISSQYAALNLNEGYSGASFEIVDRAIAPEHKAWPPRRLFLYLLLVCSAIVGAITIIATLFWRKIQKDPAQNKRLTALRQSFRFSR